MVPPRVSAVVVDHVVRLNPSHRVVLLPGEAARAEGRGGDGVAPGWRVGRAAARFEVGVPRDEGLVPVVGLVLAVLRGPRRGVPYGPIQPHRPHREGRRALPRVPPYGYVVHEESENT